MSLLFLEYPKCSTCRKAKAFLEENNVSYIDRHIVDDNPDCNELRSWYITSGLPIRRFFNTSGNLYKELKLKDKLDNMDDYEKIALLAQNGMLVKRPIVVGDDFVLVGFKEDEWREKLL